MIEGLTDVQKDKRISLRQAVGFIVSVPVAAAFVVVGLTLGLPYAPTTVQRYSIVPNVVCPGQEIETITAFTVTQPRLGSVKDFSVDSVLVSADGSKRIGLPITTFPFDAPPINGVYGFHDNASPVKRFAPNEPGVWTLETTLTTYGDQLLHRRVEDTVTGIVSNSVKVLPFSNSRCKEADGA